MPDIQENQSGDYTEMPRNLVPMIYLLFGGLIIICNILFASYFPIINDEAYYLAFAKSMQLSFIDSPPFVAYLTYLQAELGYTQPLILRFFVILLHFLSTMFLLLIVKNNSNNDKFLFEKLFVTFLLAYIVPAFGVTSFFILPDCGLFFSLSLMLWVVDKVHREKELSILYSLLLGVGLGIGLLSKYHIMPLGGGLLLGLYLDLVFIKKTFCINILLKLIICLLLGLLIAAPVWVWNYNNHYASFIFQLEHGYYSTQWRLQHALIFLIGVSLYLTPWVAYFLLKNGLFKNIKFYLLIPASSLFLILIISSLRTKALPHWLTPVFWLLIPYAVLYTPRLQRIKKIAAYTMIIWIPILLILLLPEGMNNIKKISKLINPDTSYLADLLLWDDIKKYTSKNASAQQMLTNLSQTQRYECKRKTPLIGTARWYWAAQLEQIFQDKYKVLNLDQNSSNFYNWRDNLVEYANCPIVLFVPFKKVSDLEKIININNYHIINDAELVDYSSLQIAMIDATLKSREVLIAIQEDLLNNPRY
ncbi:MAG: glycosyltransferase family 39 protein [Legionellaceae bacterium]|nr:glycosyltransferase family 39 protein [Legionellaceae bacterium]